MSFLHIAAALVSLAGIIIQPAQQVYHFSWQIRTIGNNAPVANVWTMVNEKKTDGPTKIVNDSVGVDITAHSAIVIDKASGATLWEKNAAEVRSIGSITKLMTALVFLDRNPGWDTLVELTPDDRETEGHDNLILGERYRLRDIFATSLIASDNEATNVLARSTGLTATDFVKAMNDKARKLKLYNSNFAEPTGLLPDNQSTAKELVTLAQTAFNQPDIQRVTSQKKYSFTAEGGQVHTIISTNKLASSFVTIDAAKTGFITQAGYCLLAEVEKAGHAVYIVMLGSQSDANRFQDTKMLAFWTWDNFLWPGQKGRG